MMGLATRAVSTVWSTLSWGTRLAASAGVLKARRLGAKRVVSVGNIQAGGAGKTPLVARLAREGLERGLSVGILCRGYRSPWEFEGGVLAPRQAANALECGDEAALLRELVPGAWIGVGADRVASYARIEEQAGKLDLAILDDGFQHWKIHRDLDIVALTSRGPSDVPYRDFFGALRRAGLVVWTKGEREPEGLSAGSFVRVRFEVPRGEGRVWLVTGVGDPAAVFEAVRKAGYSVDRHEVFPDHAAYEANPLRELVDRAKQAGARAATTGKDWVKWKQLGISPADALVLEPELRFEGEAAIVWNRTLWEGM